VAAAEQRLAPEAEHPAFDRRFVPFDGGLVTPAARSIFVFGVYVCLVGIGLVTLPNLVIGPLGFPPAREPWIRVLGAVAFVLGLYYVQAGRENVVAFFRWSLWGRGLILVGFTGLVVFRQAPAALILFGVVDALGAAWTYVALRGDRRAS
jgi:hypothetical protein